MREQPDIEGIVAGRDRRVGGEHALRRGRLERGGETPARAAMPSRTSSRIRNAAWPSFMCQTAGARPSARSARTPPSPRIISWRMRTVASPPYRRCVISRSSTAFSLQLVSSRYTETRPTRAFQMRAHHVAPGDAAPCTCSQLPVGVAHRLDRQIARIGFVVAGVLHAVAVDGLDEIALGIEQSDRDEIQPLIAGGLAVIAGQDPQAAGVDREALVKAVLGAEIGDQRLIGARRCRQIGVERLEHLAVALQIDRDRRPRGRGFPG